MKPLNIKGIENGWLVDEKVWRGAQPDDAAWLLLAAAGCRSVIDLNNSGAVIEPQRTLVSAAGMLYVSLDWSGILPPSLAKVDDALLAIDAGPNPTFVHCQHGSDRTGTLCACWRIHNDKWSFDQAMQEAFFSLGTQGLHEFWMAAAVAEYAVDFGPKV
jgi:tyrosine-protein phosphatase SIW14